MLFPEIEPYHTFRLKVDDLHEIYIEECGNPAGRPILFIHGGPGGGLSEKHRRYFNPYKYRIILFDQRGAGKSTPYAELKNNSTWHLVSDMEEIRRSLQIEQWHLFGGSWGSTLALCYAIKNPERVSAMILRGIFLCRSEELNWFYQEGADRIFPEAFSEYRDLIPQDERHSMIEAYYIRLTSMQESTRLEAAKAWSKWEGSALKLLPDTETIQEFNEISVSLARIECHYFLNCAFLETDNWILENINTISHIKARIIHGRYDMVCPVKNAYDLNNAWANSELQIIPDAGHAGTESGIINALIKATNDFY